MSTALNVIAGHFMTRIGSLGSVIGRFGEVAGGTGDAKPSKSNADRQLRNVDGSAGRVCAAGSSGPAPRRSLILPQLQQEMPQLAPREDPAAFTQSKATRQTAEPAAAGLGASSAKPPSKFGLKALRKGFAHVGREMAQLGRKGAAQVSEATKGLATDVQQAAASARNSALLSALRGNRHKWEPEQRFVLALGKIDDVIANGANVKAADHQLPPSHRLSFSAMQSTARFGQPLGARSLAGLDLESRLDLTGHGDAAGIGDMDAGQLAETLRDAGLRQVGVLKIEACNVGKADFLNQLRDELSLRGIQVGYLSAPTDYFSENRTYTVHDGKEKVVSELPILPDKMVGSLKPAAWGMRVVKGNVDVKFEGTRYNLP